ncbi:MAG: soluble lytic murein transglycosylase [Acidobacteriota bacterium]|jgi:soluble lytic murein transglycosylase|nr:soluble lytic murein transglycosylase [Acidobacteriota bacterium]
MAAIVSLILVCSSLTASTFAPAQFGQVNLGTTSLSISLQPQDNELSNVRRLDREGRGADGALAQLTPAEHIRRAGVYLTNRAFAEARAHFQTLIERYPNDVNVPAALYGTGRSYSQVRRHEEALPFFERVARDYAQTKEGREGLYSLASSLLRLGRASEAAARYREYTEQFPAGERVEFAYLNVIDSLREAGRPQDAISWITQTRAKYTGTPTATNALFARLRLDVAGGDWQHAIQTADELRTAAYSRKVMTSPDEVTYLRAYSLERAGRVEEATNAYLTIPDRADSYYGGLATARLLALNSPSRREMVNARAERVKAQIIATANLYPAQYREAILREATRRKVDPRLVLAIMRQESGFRPRAKSMAAARGLLQLTIDTASKYAAHVGLNNLSDEDLYRPETSILLGSEYLADLSRQFPDLPEAVAASYNGGEDNVARWVKRARQRDPGVFTAEVGFDETKNYVYKVMANYRAYKQLYTADLRPRL